MEQRKQRRQQRTELGKRRSAASQNRMRIISQLAEEGVGKKSKRSKEDTFGMDDDDWNVYRAIVSGVHVTEYNCQDLLHKTRQGGQKAHMRNLGGGGGGGRGAI